MSLRSAIHHRVRRGLAAVVVSLLSSVVGVPAMAAELLVDNGVLTGARHVLVGTTFYDVTFKDGTCESLFSGCNNSQGSGISDSDRLAPKALLDQVLIDGPAGQFDSHPELTRGCVDTSCTVVTLVGYLNGLSRTHDATNRSGSNADFVSGFPSDHGPGFDTTTMAGTTFALWTLSAPVPEPSAFLMGGMGLAVIVAMQRRRQRQACGQPCAQA